ncbi:MAG: hypothetical protein RI897_4363 [Verrucomicrobiota bacterium]
MATRDIVLRMRELPLAVLLGLCLLGMGTGVLGAPAKSAGEVVFEQGPERAGFFPNLRVGAGVGVVQGVDVDSFEYGGMGLGGGEVRFEAGPGVTVAVGGGMSIPSWLHLELETGVSHNAMEVELPGLATISGDYWQVPLLVNATVPWALTDRLDLFGGLGLGAVIGVVDFSSAKLGPGLSGSMDVAESELGAAGALQLFGGVRYRVSECGAVALGYRFRGTTPPKWSADLWELDLDRVFTHTVAVTYEWKW